MKKIILIWSFFITIRDFHRFGLEYLLDMGYNVEVWRVWDGFIPKVRFNADIGMYTGKNVLDLSLLEFDRKVKNSKNAIFILMSYQSHSYIYIRAMAKYKCKYILINGGSYILQDCSLPSRRTCRNRDKRNKKDVLLERLRQLYCLTLIAAEKFDSRARVDTNHRQLNPFASIKQGYTRISLDAALKRFRSHLPAYVFLGIDVKDDWLKYIPKDRKTYIHAWDYDRYLEERDKDMKENHIVYIDQGYGNVHEETPLFGYVDPWSDKKAHGKMAKIFDQLEEHYRLPVVIAGHPNVKYDSEFIYNRKIIFNKTPELIANSKFVIMQLSASISMALLFKKDILVLIDHAFQRQSNWMSYFMANYKYFGITPCNMDSPKMAAVPWEYVHKIDDKTAQEYINEYVKMPGTPDRLFIEVVEEKIRKM